VEATHRKLVWVWLARLNFGVWTCSECAWVFNPLGPPIGDSLEEMQRHFEEQRDKDFAAHVCVEHPKPKTPKPKP
jgi:hypothetical protein